MCGEGCSNFFLRTEMMLWDSTHRDVHPAPTSYDEAWEMTLEYAGAIRAAFPDLEIHGPISVGACAPDS